VSAHSPLPWRWVDQKGDELPKLVDARGETVCSFGEATQFYPVEGTPPKEADAALIAAAPEMAKALRCLLDEWELLGDTTSVAIQRARALLARIDGAKGAG